MRAAQAAAGVPGGVDVAPRFTELQRDPAADAGAGIRVSLAVRPLLSGASGTRPPVASALAGTPRALSAAAASSAAAGTAAAPLAGAKRGRLDVEEPEAESTGGEEALDSAEASAGPGASRAPPAAAAASHAPGSSLSNLNRLVADDARHRQQQAARASAPSRFDRPAPTVGGLSGGRAAPAASSSAPAPATEAAAAAALDEQPWLLPGIIVKVLNERVGEGRFYKAKAVVEDVTGDGFVAVLRVVDGGAVLKVDQADLQTVVPRRGGAAVIVRGPHRGARAELLDIDEAAFCATLRLAPAAGGATLRGVEYEDFSRLAED